MAFQVPDNEIARLEALARYDILDTEEEEFYNDITRLVASIMDTPMATVTFIDETRQWFKSQIGMNAKETSRDVAFCTHTIMDTKPMIVRDALKDKRFAQNPLVTGKPCIRFYFGSPIVTDNEESVGTVCALDNVPRDQPNKFQMESMETLSNIVMGHLKFREVIFKFQNQIQKLKDYEIIEYESSSNELADLYKELNDQCDAVLSRIREKRNNRAVKEKAKK